ncbi:MAG: helix-turn-helix transcriptional regulator [Planctomycetaceae bacterium]|nr:helix-turn-helix transcriptional regulator [Planctomycetaceae bacterium]
MSKNDVSGPGPDCLVPGESTRVVSVHSSQLPIMKNRWGIYWLALADYSSDFADISATTCYDILATFGGQGQRWIDGQWRTMKTNDVFLGRPGQAAGQRGRPNHRWHQAIVLYYPEHRAAFLSQVPAAGIVHAEAEPLRSAIQGLHREFVGPASGDVMDAWLTLIDAQARRLIGDPGPPLRLTGLWQQVEADLARAWTMADLAGLANMSEHHLWLLCRQEALTSPMHYVTRLRMNRAVGLLDGDHTIDHVARMVGYEDAFAFSKAFKRHRGMSPAHYRSTK